MGIAVAIKRKGCAMVNVGITVHFQTANLTGENQFLQAVLFDLFTIQGDIISLVMANKANDTVIPHILGINFPPSLQLFFVMILETPFHKDDHPHHIMG